MTAAEYRVLLEQSLNRNRDDFRSYLTQYGGGTMADVVLMPGTNANAIVKAVLTVLAIDMARATRQ